MKLLKGVETAGGGSRKQRRSVRHMNPVWLGNYWSNKCIKCFVCQSNNAPTYLVDNHRKRQGNNPTVTLTELLGRIRKTFW